MGFGEKKSEETYTANFIFFAVIFFKILYMLVMKIKHKFTFLRGFAKKKYC